MPRPLDLTGQRFGRLTAMELLPERKNNNRVWRCRCDCGGTADVVVSCLGRGNTRSCGCLQRETAANTGRDSGTKHGKCYSPEYVAWRNMHQRCYNPKRTSYEEYGGRGISVCERWHTFENFYADMGKRPKNFSLDRIDFDGHYEPGNCRWATHETQQNNRRDTRILEFRGRKQSIAQWAREVGMSKTTLRDRLKAGMSVEEALTAQVMSPAEAGRRRRRASRIIPSGQHRRSNC